MIRLLLVFLVLFAAAALGIALLPASSPPSPVAASVANEPHDQARQTVAPSDVRVVYPAPGASTTSTAPALPPPAAVTASVPPPPAAAPLDPHAAESVVPVAAAPPADAAAPVPAAGVNLNTASIEALNGLGGGHIGRTIASHRPYGSVEELLTRRVVRKSVYDQIKDHVATQ